MVISSNIQKCCSSCPFFYSVLQAELQEYQSLGPQLCCHRRFCWAKTFLVKPKDTSNKSKDETSTSEHNLDWDNFS